MNIQYGACCCVLVLCMISLHHGSSIVFNVTVSLDGKANYRRIGDAVAAAPRNSKSRFYIHVKPGTYNEHVVVPSDKTFIALIGDDASTTVIVDSRCNGTGFGTTNSATFTVKGANFMAQSISFTNSAGPGPAKGPAVALLDQAEQTTYYKCRFLGYQDTLYVNGGETFFKECEIYGTVDFIFGKAAAVFQDCNVYARLPNTTITITAQSKELKAQKSGFIFQRCTITASPELVSGNDGVVADLGRPWRNFSTVVFMKSYMDDIIDPKGWLEWSGQPLNLLFYGEFFNYGPGADASHRVKWPGYHTLTNPREVIKFTVKNFINGSQWLPETGVPFRPGF